MIAQAVDASEVLKALGYLGIGTVVTTIVTGVFTRKKLSADATKIITEAAGAVVETLRQENARYVAEKILLEGKVEAGRIENQANRDDLRMLHQAVAQHVMWDQQVKDVLRSNGIDVPEPPQLPGPSS